MMFKNYEDILNTVYIEPEFQPVDIWDRYEREDGTLVKLYKHRPHYLDVTTRNPNKEEMDKVIEKLLQKDKAKVNKKLTV